MNIKKKVAKYDKIYNDLMWWITCGFYTEETIHFAYEKYDRGYPFSDFMLVLNHLKRRFIIGHNEEGHLIVRINTKRTNPAYFQTGLGAEFPLIFERKIPNIIIACIAGALILSGILTYFIDNSLWISAVILWGVSLIPLLTLFIFAILRKCIKYYGIH